MDEPMNERELRIEVAAEAAGYVRTVRYTTALACEATHGYRFSIENPRYGAAAASTMWAAEILHLMINEGMSREAAELEAEGRCEPGSDPEHLLGHARRVRGEEERFMSRQVFLRMHVETLAEMWSMHKGDNSGQSHTADDLTEIYERPAEDAEREELIDYVPGSEEELREVLRRRRRDR